MGSPARFTPATAIARSAFDRLSPASLQPPNFDKLSLLVPPIHSVSP